MIEADKARFVAGLKRLCVVHERRLDGDGFEVLASAYWTALQRMDVNVFERVIDKAVEVNDRFPKPSTLWALAKDMRRPAKPVDHWESGPVDPLQVMASQVMMRWLFKRVSTVGTMPDATLHRVAAENRRLLAFHRQLVDDHDPEAVPARFERLFVAAADQLAPAP